MTSRGTLRPAATAMVVGAFLAGCGSSPAPALSATGSKAFTYDIAHREFAGPVFASTKPANLISLGQGLCSQLDRGRTVAQLNEGLLSTRSLTASATEDGEFVSTVVVTLCPKYVAQITGAAPASAAH